MQPKKTTITPAPLKPLSSKKLITPKATTTGDSFNKKPSITNPSSTNLANTLSSTSTAASKAQITSGAARKMYEAMRPPTASKRVWSDKKGIEYDGVQDFDQPELEEDGYFESQLERSIKHEVNKDREKTPLSVPKNQVILPKLKKQEAAGNLTGQHKNLKLLEKELEDEMSRMMYEDMEKEGY